ncbi:MAG: redox-regulated ATPase YchF [Microgenomates group bacterium]|jgi:hypothetical protein
MNLSVGIVGLPNVGKSTLFNALLKKRVALSANYPFATIEPNVGVVAVPDERLEKLADLVAAEKSTSGESKPTPEVSQRPPVIPAVVEFVDIAGLVKGAATGAGLGNQFLSHIREVDAIIEVVRDFNDENVIREGSENPDADKLIIETELGLSDLSVVEKLVAAQEKQAKVAKDQIETEKLEILNQIKKELEEGRIIGNYQVGDERLKEWFKTLPLLTIKPLLYVYNVSEDEYAGKIAASTSSLRNDESVIICAKLEEELADYSDEEKKEYLHELGIEQTGLERLIIKAYDLLGLISFLTQGKKEVRAWTIKKGSKAPQAAGVIHTDFEKGFIRAQVIPYEKLIEAGSLSVAKTKGWLRTEGKEYIMQDGDVVEFLVSS